MSEFQEIEKEYLKIDPLSEDLIKFYEKHLGYFEKQYPLDDEELGKYIWMLCDIGQSFCLAEQHKKALLILNKSISLIIKFSKRLNIYLENDQKLYTSIWCKAYSLFKLRKYFLARSNFLKLKGKKILNKDYEYEIYLKVCNQKTINRISIAIGILGFLILGIKYGLKLFFTEHYNETIEYTGSFGAILLIISGLIYKRKVKLQ